jgi:hypothetical protein
MLIGQSFFVCVCFYEQRRGIEAACLFPFAHAATRRPHFTR